MKLIEQFEDNPRVKKVLEYFDVYYTNLGGYHFKKDSKPCFYLNGMLDMFEAINKEK